MYGDLYPLVAIETVEVDKSGISTLNGNIPNVIDSCLSSEIKFSPGACGCSIQDLDQNQNGTIDCMELPRENATPGIDGPTPDMTPYPFGSTAGSSLISKNDQSKGSAG